MINNYEKKELKKLFPQIKGFFSPKIIGEVNDACVKITRVKGDDVPWHTHENEDELFYIAGGSLVMEIDGKSSFKLNEGELFIVPKGVKHRVFSEEECWVLLIENKTTAHTGNIKSSITKTIEERM